ncbi:DUF4153 domain-containing protein [Nocardia sp. NPDC059177]|uniref:DUF4153 domain-containing protein n=1 Tax=Nocardia sp. NPDC059177 TaxID=3346759 RepID=UPI0036B4D80A
MSEEPTPDRTDRQSTSDPDPTPTVDDPVAVLDGPPIPWPQAPVPAKSDAGQQSSGIAQLHATSRNQSGTAGTMPPMPPPPPPLPAVPSRWQLVARPAGVLPAAAVAGIVGATLIPLDRPGIGWFLTGAAITAALCAVDYRARSLGKAPLDESAVDISEAAAAEAHSAASGDGGARAGDAGSRTDAGTTAADSREPAGSMPAVDVIKAGAARAESDADTDTAGAAHADSAAAVISEAGAPQAETADVDNVSAAGAEPVALVVGADAESIVPVKDSVTEAGPASGLSEVARQALAASRDSAAPGGNSPVTVPGTGDLPAAGAGPATPVPGAGATTASGLDSGDGAARPGLRDRAWWAGAALVLLGVGAVRAAGWLFVLCVLAACVAGSLAVLGRRSSRGVVHDMIAVPLAVFGAVPWAFSGTSRVRPNTRGWGRYGVSVGATVALLVVFVPLLGGADATFAGLLNGLVPEVDAASAWQWIVLFAVVGMGALGALYLLAGPPTAASAGSRPRRLWSRGEWVLPVGALTVLFAVFVGAQFVALFGGDDYVQRTSGLTYAEYARSGFWQLSAVSILTLGVILAVLHWSAQESAADRRWLRVLLSGLSVLTLVIVCSALGRMWTYQQAYGFTVLRLLVEVCELWVGLVYVLVLVAIARLRWSWVSRAAIGTALATLIALALLNPERFVAERNIARWQDGERLDTSYLRELSPDVLPALTELPAPLRTEIETPILADLDSDPWWAWNLSRSSAR